MPHSLSRASALVSSAALLGAIFVLWRRRRRGVASQPSHPPEKPAGPSSVPRATTAADVAAAVRAEGVCVVERVFDAEQLAQLEARLKTIEPRKLQNRRAHRWEHVHSPEAAPFAELAALPVIADLVRALLGPKHYLEKAGLLVSHPGAEAQRWHMDTPHLFSVGSHLPPHSLSVFVPLVDLVGSDGAAPTNGPTEFQLATHVKAHLVLPQRQAAASCAAGSIVVYDVRIMHRGGPNRADAERPVVYLTFVRAAPPPCHLRAPPRRRVRAVCSCAR